MIFLNLLKPTGIDFPIFYDASGMLSRGLNFYKYLTLSPGPFNYPPTSFLFLWWLGLLPYNVSGLIWNLFSVAAFVFSIYFLSKIGNVKQTLIVILFIVFFTIPFFPEKHNLASGQINNFVLLFCTLSLYFYVRGKKISSAMLLAFATGIKLVPGIFVLFFLIKKDFKTIALFFISLLFLWLLSLLIVPWEIQKTYFTDVFFQALPISGKNNYYNQSLLGFLARSFTKEIVIRIFQYFLSGLLIVTTFVRGRKISDLRGISAVSCLYLILHPLAWQHHFVFATIPIILLTADFLKSKSDFFNIKMVSPLIIAYVLIAWNIKQPGLIPKEFNLVLSHAFFGAMALWLFAISKENFWKISAIIWTLAILTIYFSFSLCRAGICL